MIKSRILRTFIGSIPGAGADIAQGLTPGPLLFEQNPDIVYGLFSAIILGPMLEINLRKATLRKNYKK